MRVVVKVIPLVLLLVGLPLLGIIMAGQPLDHYLDFPPRTHYVHQAPFSWTVFRGGSGWLDSLFPFLSGASRVADYAAVSRVVRLS